MGMPLEIDSLEELEENKVLKIKIYGEAYDGVIDATVASAIIEIQNRIYQFAAQVKFGDERETRRLGRDVRKSLLVQFRIERGCTEILADLVLTLVEIVRPVFEKMTPEQLIEVAKYLAALFAGYKITDKVIQAVKEKTLGQQRDLHEEKILQQQADALIQSGRQASEAMARLLPKATEINFGATKYTNEELQAMRETAPKERAKRQQRQKTYIVERIDLRRRPVIYLDLLEVPADVVVKAQYTEAESDAFYDDDTTMALCSAAASGEEIQLDIVESRTSQGELTRVDVIAATKE